jgi:hypothetical protein
MKGAVMGVMFIVDHFLCILTNRAHVFGAIFFLLKAMYYAPV